MRSTRFMAEREVRRLERNTRVRDRRLPVSLVRRAAESVAPAAAVAEPRAIDLVCEPNDAGPLAWLDLASDDPDNVPSRVRVFERGGNVICVSDPALHGVVQ